MRLKSRDKHLGLLEGELVIELVLGYLDVVNTNTKTQNLFFFSDGRLSARDRFSCSMSTQCPVVRC